MNELAIKFLVGSWFIIQTTYPMWHNPRNTNPTLNYTPGTHKGKPVLIDEVKYNKNGKAKVISGYDYQVPTNPNALVWKGKGLLGMFTSNCEVRLKDPSGQWAVIWFSRTLFTPEGVDIISRKPEIGSLTMYGIMTEMSIDSVLKDYVYLVKPLPGKK